MNFAVIAHIDTWRITSWLYARRKQFREEERLGNACRRARYLILRAPPEPATADGWTVDEPQADYMGDPKESDAPRVLLNRCRRMLQIANPTLEVGEIGKAWFEHLGTGEVIDWRRDAGPYAEAHVRFHVPIIVNPGERLISGTETFLPIVGVMMSMAHLIPHSAINMGETARVHLVVDFRKPA